MGENETIFWIEIDKDKGFIRIIDYIFKDKYHMDIVFWFNWNVTNILIIFLDQENYEFYQLNF